MAEKQTNEGGVMYGAHWQPKPLPYDADLANFRRNGLSDGFDGYSCVKGETDRSAGTDEVIHYDIVRSIVGQDYFDRHYSCGVGNPYTVEHDGKPLTTSDIAAVYNCWQIQRWAQIPASIVEIGPGYGALAANLRRVYPAAETEITLVDLPEHHEILRYYLDNTAGLDGIHITDKPPDDAELVIALRCMMEMPIPEVRRYLELIQLMPSLRFFYLISRYLKRGYGLRLYPFDKRWVPILSQYEPAARQTHELMLKRLPMESHILGATMRTLPPFLTDDKIYLHDSRVVQSPRRRS